MEIRKGSLCLTSKSWSHGIEPLILPTSFTLRPVISRAKRCSDSRCRCEEPQCQFHLILPREAPGLPALDFARFAEIATGSLFEVVSQSAIARRQGFLNESDYLKTYQDAERLGKMLSGLRSALLSQ